MSPQYPRLFLPSTPSGLPPRPAANFPRGVRVGSFHSFSCPMPTRSASAHWSGSLSDGSGAISTESTALSDKPYSFSSRFEENGEAGTNPEELLGAAHAGCFTMSVSHALAEAGHPPTRAETTAKVHLEQLPGGFEIPKIDLVLTADVPGISEDEFQEIANDAKENCPLSKVLKAAEITLDATLTSS